MKKRQQVPKRLAARSLRKTWPACDAYIWKFVERHAQFYHFVPLSKGWA